MIMKHTIKSMNESLNEVKKSHGVELDFAVDALLATLKRSNSSDDVRDWGDANPKKALTLMKQIAVLEKKIREM